MTPKQVYTAAAKLIDEGPKGFTQMQKMYEAVGTPGYYESEKDISTGCCLAIDVVQMKDDSDESRWTARDSPLRDDFEEAFQPAPDCSAYWFGSLTSEKVRNERVLALLFMAQAHGDL